MINRMHNGLIEKGTHGDGYAMNVTWMYCAHGLWIGHAYELVDV